MLFFFFTREKYQSVAFQNPGLGVKLTKTVKNRNETFWLKIFEIVECLRKQTTTKNRYLNEQQKQSRETFFRQIVKAGAHYTLPHLKGYYVMVVFGLHFRTGHLWAFVLIPLSQSRMEKRNQRRKRVVFPRRVWSFCLDFCVLEGRAVLSCFFLFAPFILLSYLPFS